jgi:hypothetical protein
MPVIGGLAGRWPLALTPGHLRFALLLRPPDGDPLDPLDRATILTLKGLR